MRLGIRAKLFLISIGLILASLLVFYAYTRARLDSEVTDRLRAQLVIRAQLVAERAESAGAALADVRKADELADALGAAAQARVTFIGPDGVVYGDSQVPLGELPRVENHGRRPEVLGALAGNVGVAQRLSATVHQRMLYVAVPLKSPAGVAGVARVALPLEEVSASVSAFQQVLAVAVILALGLAILLSSAAAHLVTRSIARLTATARSMAAGRLKERTRVDGNDEFSALGRAINTLAENLSNSLEAVERERDRLGGMFSGMQEGVLLLDSAGQVVLMNPALREMLLLSQDDVGKNVRDVVHSKGLLDTLEAASHASGPLTLELLLEGLKPRELSVRAAPLEADHGGVFAVFVDMTQVRRLESVRRDFVANVSHELRTPVTAIRSAAETLQLSGVKNAETQQRFVAMIERNAQRLQDLVEDLLDLSSIESQNYKIQYEPFDALEFFPQMLSLFADRAAKRQVRIECDIEQDLPLIKADGKAFDHILTNLIDNAVKYAGERAVVRVTAKRSGADGVRISVEDNGQGIPQEHLPRLFERFYRVDTGRSREVGGTGLGLSIVKHLVETMGGRITVESEMGRGTTFSFTLRVWNGAADSPSSGALRAAPAVPFSLLK